MPYCCQCQKTYREGVFGLFVCDSCKQKNVERKKRLAKQSEKRKQKDKSPADSSDRLTAVLPSKSN